MTPNEWPWEFEAAQKAHEKHVNEFESFLAQAMRKNVVALPDAEQPTTEQPTHDEGGGRGRGLEELRHQLGVGGHGPHGWRRAGEDLLELGDDGGGVPTTAGIL
jgi:hypothetical protein